MTTLDNFWKLLLTNFHTKEAQIFIDCLGNIENMSFEVKTHGATFRATFGKIGLLFIPTYGHIEIKLCQSKHLTLTDELSFWAENGREYILVNVWKNCYSNNWSHWSQLHGPPALRQLNLKQFKTLKICLWKTAPLCILALKIARSLALDLSIGDVLVKTGQTGFSTKLDQTIHTYQIK